MQKVNQMGILKKIDNNACDHRVKGTACNKLNFYSSCLFY